MLTQLEKAHAFRALHEREGAFIIPNPYDAGTARLLAHLGFEALATTSAGASFSAGKPDYGVNREEMLAHVAMIAAAVDLPVSGDLESGFGDAPEVVAETIRLAAESGLVGGSIEDAKDNDGDSTNREGDPIYAIEVAAERIRAAAGAAHGLGFPFTLTARAENYLHGRNDLADTIKRLQAYREAGADVLYAPGITNKEEIATLVRAVDRPVNVLAGLGDATLDAATLAAIGVKRISVGSALSRAALGAFFRAAHEMRDHGTFTFAGNASNGRELNRIFSDQSKRGWRYRLALRAHSSCDAEILGRGARVFALSGRHRTERDSRDFGLALTRFLTLGGGSVFHALIHGGVGQAVGFFVAAPQGVAHFKVFESCRALLRFFPQRL
jgi:2-methylisocitrate lyase-like PEP mutase family enzyme